MSPRDASSARDIVLARVRQATRDVPADEAPAYEWSLSPAPSGGDDLADLLAARIADYGATVVRVGGEDVVPDAVAAILEEHAARRIAIPADLPATWRPSGVDLLPDAPPIGRDALDVVDGVLTGCALAIAETGTIVLDGGPGQGRRAITLLPDLHLCVVARAQIVPGVADAFAALGAATRPTTFVSGPSATSDIELIRVEGVHGPRRLAVVIVG